MNNTKKNSNMIRDLALLGVLTAITVIMAFTPIGYLKIGFVDITFLAIPVAVGAMMLGIKGGAVLGAVFGITSFIQCYMGSPLGVFLLPLNPFYTAIVCLVPRIAMGILAALIFKGMVKLFKKDHVVAYCVSAVSAALLNTVFFVGALALLFGSHPAVLEAYKVENAWLFLVAFVASIGWNIFIEAGVTLVVAAALGKSLNVLIKRRNV